MKQLFEIKFCNVSVSQLIIVCSSFTDKNIYVRVLPALKKIKEKT